MQFLLLLKMSKFWIKINLKLQLITEKEEILKNNNTILELKEILWQKKALLKEGAKMVLVVLVMQLLIMEQGLVLYKTLSDFILIS